jgi:CRP-like cAMP-binding protein
MADALLRQAPLVRAMGDQALAVLRRGIGLRYLDQVPVFQEADAGSSLYLVLKGEARLFARSGTELVQVGAAAKGEVFGEDEILARQERRSCTAIAAGALELVELPHTALLECGETGWMTHLRELQHQRRVSRDELSAFLNRW